jgi:hypothetical protein
MSQSLGPKALSKVPNDPLGNVGVFDFKQVQINLSQPPIFGSESHNIYDDEDFQLERQAIEERRLDLARELDEETRKRREAEEALERVKEEFLKKELEDSRYKSELQARID